MDSAYEVDFDALLRVLRSGNHLIVRFSTVGQRLFLDFRTSAEEGPGVYLLGTADSREERLATIAAARPNFPRPEPLSVLAWPLRVGSLDRLGFFEAARARLAGMDAFGPLRALDAAYTELLAAERDEIRRAITGDGYRTLWAAGTGR